MGWLHTRDATRKDIIAERTKDWATKDMRATCLAHCAKGNVLWTVWEHVSVGEKKVFIGCDILSRQKGFGWGYKAMGETMGPCYYSCPMKYLDMAPATNEAWREKVKAYHAKEQRKLEVGKSYELVGCLIPHVQITSIRPLRGTYEGTRYRIRKQIVGSEL